MSKHSFSVWLWIVTIGCCIIGVMLSNPYVLYSLRWAVAQWIPIRWTIQQSWQQAAWDHWERDVVKRDDLNEKIPTVNVQEHLGDLLEFLEKKFGSDWRSRPLLFKNLWSQNELKYNSHRRLSLKGLLQENLTIPYYTDARKKGAITPDGTAPVQDIVANISKGAPHKIGTQLVVQHYPEIITEVAPTRIVTQLFGSYFTPNAIRGTGPFQLLPALTTVPIFVANGKRATQTTKLEESDEITSQTQTSRPYTTLHCEPIGNIAVQLSGQKKWTLIRPEFSTRLKPAASPDGRAFFASWQSPEEIIDNQVSTYTAITAAGDAMWVPAWTWHRVDYIESDEIAIGASIFHFRAVDFFRNNPVFAFLIIPAILLELVGYSTQ